MAAGGGTLGVQTQRRRRRQSLLTNDKPDIEDDALMASSIGDNNWLQQSMWKNLKTSKQVSIVTPSTKAFVNYVFFFVFLFRNSMKSIRNHVIV